MPYQTSSPASPLEMVFWACALTGTLFFIIRVVMMLTGSATDSGLDSHGDLHGDMATDGSSDVAFHVFSINTITAFFMMFGWVGLTCYKQFALGATLSIGLAFLSGVLCMLITAYLFKAARKLVSRGSAFSLPQTVAKRATVYSRIPAAGRGKITVSVGDMSHEVEAVSADKTDIESFQTVEVVQVVDDRTVSVKRV